MKLDEHGHSPLPGTWSDSAWDRPIVHVLHVRGPLSPPKWIADAIGPSSVIDIQEAASLTIGLERLRQEAFDVVLLDRDASAYDPADILRAIQAVTHDHQPILVLDDADDRQQAADYLEAGAMAFLSLRQTTTRELIWQFRTAAQRGHLLTTNRQLKAWHHQHAEREQRTILALLADQQSVVDTSNGEPSDEEFDANGWTEGDDANRDRMVGTCRELLQAHILMGQGRLGTETRQWVAAAREEQISLSRVIEAFTLALRQLVSDRGARSSRHIYDRGNLLLLDILHTWAQELSGKDDHGCFSHHSDL